MGQCLGRDKGAYTVVGNTEETGAVAAAEKPNQAPAWLVRMFGSSKRAEAHEPSPVLVPVPVLDAPAMVETLTLLRQKLEDKQTKQDRVWKEAKIANKRKEKRVVHEAILYWQQLREEVQDLGVLLLRVDRVVEAANQAEINKDSIVALQTARQLLERMVAAVSYEDVIKTQEDLDELLSEVNATTEEMTRPLATQGPEMGWREVEALEAELDADSDTDNEKEEQPAPVPVANSRASPRAMAAPPPRVPVASTGDDDDMVALNL
jgi:hypothetical protein